jgi:hypothetical protein
MDVNSATNNSNRGNTYMHICEKNTIMNLYFEKESMNAENVPTNSLKHTI